MQETEFNFESFLSSKGFNKINDQYFKYVTDEGFELILEICDNKYLMSFTPENIFKSDVPDSFEKANKSFDTMGEIMGISFNK